MPRPPDCAQSRACPACPAQFCVLHSSQSCPRTTSSESPLLSATHTSTSLNPWTAPTVPDHACLPACLPSGAVPGPTLPSRSCSPSETGLPPVLPTHQVLCPPASSAAPGTQATWLFARVATPHPSLLSLNTVFTARPLQDSTFFNTSAAFPHFNQVFIYPPPGFTDKTQLYAPAQCLGTEQTPHKPTLD